MDEFESRAKLASRSKKDLSPDVLRKSNLYGWTVSIRILGPLLLAMLAVGIWYRQGILAFVLSTIVLGWAGYRVQFILHDSSHRSLFRAGRLNDVIATAAGLIVGVNFSVYRYTHMQHHRFNGGDTDPQKPDYLGIDRALSRRHYAWFIISPLLGGRFWSYVRRELLAGRPSESNSERTDIAPRPSLLWWLALVVVQVVVIAVLSWGFEHPEAALTWYLGLATIALFLARLRTLAEHQQIGTFRADFSRTHGRSIIDWMLLYDTSFNYHLEHHLYPAIQSRHLRTVFDQQTSMIHDDVSLGSTMLATIWKNYRRLPTK